MIRHNSFMRAILLSSTLVAALVSTSCNILFVSSGGSSTTYSSPAVTKVAFAGSTATVTMSGLNNSGVYLVKLNTSSSLVSAGNSGSAYNVSDAVRSAVSNEVATASASTAALCDSTGNPVSGVFETPAGKVIRYDHKASMDFSAAPPIDRSAVLASRVSNARDAAVVATAEPGTVDVTTKDFWVEGTSSVYTEIDSSSKYWKKITMTLRATSTYASVWVAQANDAQGSFTTTYGDTITHQNAVDIANTFTSLYPVETAVFGYEYGGGPSGTGGMDGKKPVDILLYDIDFDDASDPVTNGGIVGYFWGKDWNSKTSYTYSNQGEMFYIDTLFAKKASGIMYSTLAHEFQHMIDWNVKYVTAGKVPSTWYNEMLSQVAEDMLSSYLTQYASGYTAASDGPIAGRMPAFNGGYYLAGLTDWFYDSPEVYSSYAVSYAFGAYLARNYGGAALIHEIASNSSVNTSSISAALSALGASENSFASAFARYPEALLCSSTFNTSSTLAQSNTFDRSDTHTVNGYTYTFPAFDIWDYSFTYTDSSSVQHTMYGPAAYVLSYDPEIRPNGFLVQTSSSWQNVTGSLTITLNRPADSNISLYLVQRGK